MIDVHTHILPGLDDGAQTLDDSLDMARAFIDDGVTAVAATPHVRDDYPTSAEAMLRAVERLREALNDERIQLAVHSGAELDIEWLARLRDVDLRRLTLAGGGRYLLVETPYHGWPVQLVDQLLRLRRGGFTPVLAHPERNAFVQGTPSLLEPLVRGGILVQVTAASLDGRLGPRSRETGHRLVGTGLAQLIASDAHAPQVRAAGMRSATDTLDDDGLAEWLARDVPLALLEGRDPPQSPRSG